MADLTAEQQLIIGLVGDLDPASGDLPIVPTDGIVAQNIVALWDRYADKAYSPALRSAYVQRDACNLILTVLAPNVNITPPIGGSVQLKQQVETYQARLASVQLELERLEATAILSVGMPVIGPILAVTPVSRPWWCGPDASSPRYTGSPYVRSRPRPDRPSW